MKIAFAPLFALCLLLGAPAALPAAETPSPKSSLLESGGAIRLSDQSARSPEERLFRCAIFHDQDGILKLKREGVDMNLRWQGIPTIMWAAFYEDNEANKVARFGEGQECSEFQEGTVRQFLACGADVNLRMALRDKDKGATATDNLLSYALKHGNLFVVRIALDDANIDVNSPEHLGNRPLHLVVSPHYKTVHAAPYDTYEVDKPLSPAADKKSKAVSLERRFRIDDLLRTLIHRGAAVDGLDAAGNTPLHLALEAYVLLAKNEGAKARRELFLPGGRKETVSLRNASGNATYGDIYALTKLNLAWAIRALLEEGASVKLRNKEAKTPLQLALALPPEDPVRRLVAQTDAGQRPVRVVPPARKPATDAKAAGGAAVPAKPAPWSPDASFQVGPAAKPAAAQPKEPVAPKTPAEAKPRRPW